MTQHGSVLTAYHVASELYKVTGQVLSYMSQHREEYFREACSILQNMDRLNPVQRSAAQAAIADWENSSSTLVLWQLLNKADFCRLSLYP
jgi:hypothetical protein